MRVFASYEREDEPAGGGVYSCGRGAADVRGCKKLIKSLRERIIKLKVLLVMFAILPLGVYGYMSTTPATDTITKIGNIASLGLISGCLVGIVWDVLIRTDFLNYVKDELAELLSKQCKPMELLSKFAIGDVCDKRDRVRLGDYFESAKERIWVRITHFYSLTEQGCELLNILTEKSLSKNFEIKILGLNPTGESAKLRSQEPCHDDLITKIRLSGKEVISAFLAKHKDRNRSGKVKNVEIKLSDRCPTCCFFIVDSHIFFSPLVFGRRGRDSVHYLVDEKNAKGGDSKLFHQYEESFRKLLDDAQLLLKIERGTKTSSQELIEIFMGKGYVDSDS